MLRHEGDTSPRIQYGTGTNFSSLMLRNAGLACGSSEVTSDLELDAATVKAVEAFSV